MKLNQPRPLLSEKKPLTVLPFLGDQINSEWRVSLIGSVLVFFIASILMSGFPNGLIPNIQVPYSYEGDGKSVLILIQKVIEGWYFDNPRVGFPFQDGFYDYPLADGGNFILLKLLGVIFGSAAASYNLFFLLGFSVTFFFSFHVTRIFNVPRGLSFTAAIAFTFLHYHMIRLEHLFLTWYFMVPIFTYFSYRLFLGEALFKCHCKIKQCLLYALTFFTLGTFGSAYYPLFAMIMISISSLSGLMISHKIIVLLRGLVVLALISAGVIINMMPNFTYKAEHGTNTSITTDRSIGASEILGLKFSQMILPHENHRFKAFREISAEHNSKSAIVNENKFSALGLIGSIGVIILLSALFLRLINQHVSRRLSFLTILFLSLFLSATIGGFSSLFALFVSPLFRGWNRISVFIAFPAICAFFIFLNNKLTQHTPKGLLKYAQAASIFFLIPFIFIDQTTRPNHPIIQHYKAYYESDRDFINQIEASLPHSAAIYQLPYSPYPEAFAHHLNGYELGIGFIHSQTLRWSALNMTGRKGSNFYKDLAQKPLSIQIETAKNMGFSGIYIDKRGFEDQAQSLEKELHQLGFTKNLQSKNQQLVFYYLE